MYIEEGHGNLHHHGSTNHHERGHWSSTGPERQNGDSTSGDKLHVTKGSPESDHQGPGGIPRSLSDSFPLEDNNKLGGNERHTNNSPRRRMNKCMRREIELKIRLFSSDL
jgi:hypothetical protein